MGSMLGHVLPGIVFFLVGLWHLFNHIKLHILNPTSYSAQLWFPAPKLRYAEPLLIALGSTASIVIELFVSPSRHQPLDVDFTIPTNHLHTVEHSSISLALLVYGVFLILVDRVRPNPPQGLAYFMASIALGQELLLFRLHSTDHIGPEGQYHMFLQLIVAVSLATTLMGIGFPNSFMVSFVRSLSVVFQGVWFIVMGVMLWTPALLPKGCFLNNEDGKKVARCAHESLHRAMSLINIEFSWYLTATAILGVYFYVFLAAIYGHKVNYFSLAMNKLRGREEEQDTESQKKLLSKTTEDY